jgi:DNA-binding response OmpR family regulator
VAAGRVLVVDEDPGTSCRFARALEEHGYEVLVAEDGPAMWPLLELRPAKLVVVELVMAAMNGWEVIRRLRARFRETISELPSDCKIIAVSARADEETVAFVRRLGADMFLAKPVSPVALVHAVDALLSSSEQTPDEAHRSYALA